jgi:hypothetical protein
MESDATKVTQGDLMLFSYWARVETVTPTQRGGHSLNLINVDDGTTFSVHGDTLINRSGSADQFETTSQLTKTELAEKLISLFRVPFTVCFETKDGEERVLRGRLIKPEPVLGRSLCEDLDINFNEGKKRLRLVDHRTIKYIIVNNKKYVLKVRTR